MSNKKNEPINTFQVLCAGCGKRIDIEDHWDSIFSKYFCNFICREDYKVRHGLD